jgi:hypothetical protein
MNRNILGANRAADFLASPTEMRFQRFELAGVADGIDHAPNDCQNDNDYCDFEIFHDKKL